MDKVFIDTSALVAFFDRMKELKLTKYLSFDEHFKQAGFSAMSDSITN